MPQKIASQDLQEYVHAWLQESSLLKELYSEFSKQVEEVYVQEVELRAHERRLVELIEEYEKRVVVKPYIAKAEWGFSFFGGKLKPKNHQAKILRKFETLLSLLFENEQQQAKIIGNEHVKMMKLLNWENQEEQKRGIASIRKKRNEKALFIMAQISEDQSALTGFILQFINEFGNMVLHLDENSPNKIRLWREELCRRIGQKAVMITQLGKWNKEGEKFEEMAASLDLKRINA